MTMLVQIVGFSYGFKSGECLRLSLERRGTELWD
jgi:hypothetical protein